MERLIELLPKVHAEQLTKQELEGAEEIRLSVGQPMSIRYCDRETQFWPQLRQEQLEQVVFTACRQSVYAYTETLRHGFITLEGGHRIGVCGFGVILNGSVQTIRSVSSLVIRIAGQVFGCAGKLVYQVQDSALILGPPRSGKTTLLRDLVRQISDVREQRVSLVDERCELSAGVSGLPQLQIGKRTDVMVNVPKAVAAMMLLRTMAPQWIAMDEITLAEDIAVMEQIAYCGVRVLATAHGAGLDDLYHRPLYRSMMERGIFRHVILLKADKSYSVKEI